MTGELLGGNLSLTPSEYTENLGIADDADPRTPGSLISSLERSQGILGNNVLNVAFGHPTIAVDTHIFRVSNRTGIAPGRNVTEVEKKLLRSVPEEFKLDAHHWLILHGRYTCIARKPRCGSCLIEDLCEFKHKNVD